ncbi:MAG: alpha/beta hydrolase, partial [Bacteroidota bacterium]
EQRYFFIWINILFFLTMNIQAQDYTISLWDDYMPNFQEVGESDILDNESEIESYQLITEPNISVYLPAKKNSTGQAVLIIPGGGYNVVVHKWEGSDVAKWLNGNGITAIVLKYRLPHAKSNIIGYKSPLLDASRAMKIIRANSDKWRIDKNNIGVMGFSAGGHLASTLGTHYDRDGSDFEDSISTISSRPDFMVLVYPVITMSEEYVHEGSRYFLLGENQTDELKHYYSNEKHVTPDTPPTFLIHSSDDESVDVENSLSFYKALRAKSINTAMHIFQHGEHGFSLANEQGSLESWKSLCIKWLRDYNRK